MWAPVVASLVTGLITAIVAIVGQLIVGYNNLSSKKLEVLFTRKADAYKAVLEKAGEFGLDPKGAVKYLTLQGSIHAAAIVASHDVADALDSNPRISLHVAANRLRFAESGEITRIQTHEWYQALENLKLAMRSDIGRLAEPKTATLRELCRALIGIKS